MVGLHVLDSTRGFCNCVISLLGTPRPAGCDTGILSVSMWVRSVHGLGSRMAVTGALHTKARQLDYLGGVRRFPVPDDRVSWTVEYEEYRPVNHTSPHVLKGPVWADVDIR